MLFGLEQNSRCQACEQVSCRDLCILMGVSSQQRARICTMCGAHTRTGTSSAPLEISALHYRVIHIGRAAMSLHCANSQTTLSRVQMHSPMSVRALLAQSVSFCSKRGTCVSFAIAWLASQDAPGSAARPSRKIIGYELVREPSGKGLAFVQTLCINCRVAIAPRTDIALS